MWMVWFIAFLSSYHKHQVSHVDLCWRSLSTILSSAGGNNEEKVWGTVTQEASADIEGEHLFFEIFSVPLSGNFCRSHYQVKIASNNFIFWQDHERAFFDSADWALGKVLILIAWECWDNCNCYNSEFWSWLCNVSILNAKYLGLPLFCLLNSKEPKSPKDPLKHSAQSCRYLFFRCLVVFLLQL